MPKLMQKLKNLKTKIFLDGGDPEETKEIISLLGFLDGQTTNPTLIAKNPEAQARIARGEKFSKVEKISSLIPGGSVSVEVYADKSTAAEEMLKQAGEMFSWIPNAHIKFPITSEGLEVAEQFVRAGKRVNMTLCFSQKHHFKNLKPIPYQEISLNKKWQEYDIIHELTNKGIEKFSEDWNKLIK